MALDPKLRFENYVVGTANKMAVSAAHAVAKEPGLNYNPLVVYGASGVGKTHLLQAIGNAIGDGQESLRIEYLALDDFVDQLHRAVAAGETDRFKQQWGRVDVLLLDDIQFLTQRRETQSELLRLLEALQGTGRQIVMTSDRAPSEIPDVDQRLSTRLSGGLVVDIGAPDYETRVAILEARCRERGVELEPGVVEEVGKVDAANVRELQGLLNRVLAFQSLGGEPVRAEDVLTVLGDGASRESAEEPAAEPEPPQRMSRGALDFQGFLTDVANAVAEHVEGWKGQVSQAISGWKTAGYRTASLERLLNEAEPPTNFEAVLRGFGAAVKRLKEFEAVASAANPSLAGNAVFHDPERLREAQAMAESARPGEAELPPPAEEFSRAGLMVGAGNELAVKALDAVAAEPGTRYNPLILVGPAGAGKTHLLHALGNELLNASGGAARVACVSGQQFTDELIVALREGTVEQWQQRYRGADALLMDDIQVVAGKERTQDEVFRLFNDLLSAGKQLAFTSDRAPRDMQGLDERLRSRLEGGLTVELTRVSSRMPTPTHAPVAVRAASDVFFLDVEKVVWDWPDVAARLVEELP